MKRGVEVDVQHGVGGSRRSVVTEVVRHEAVAQHGYQCAGTGVDRLTFTRSLRPTWASVTAGVTAVTGVGLFFLLVKESETFDVLLSEGNAGLSVRISGRVHPELADRLGHALSASHAIGTQLARPGSVPAGLAPAGRVGFATGSEMIDVPAAPSVVEPAGDEDRTVRGGAYRRTNGMANAVRYVLDLGNGLTIPVPNFALLGRDPAARPDDPDAELVVIDDPLVSKTHLAIGADARGCWLIDRRSTNGTVVVDNSGRDQSVVAGEARYLEPGVRIRIGNRVVTVERAQ